MPKMKTNKAAAKRIKVSANGKLQRHTPGGGHLKSKKSSGQIQKYRKSVPVSDCYAKTIRALLES